MDQAKHSKSRRGAAMIAALATTSLLGACASPGTYPSLAKREAERASGAARPVQPDSPPAPVPAAPAQGLSERLAALVGQARAAHAHFVAARSGASALVARAAGSAVASENWSVAAVALADLEASRSDAMIALAELDSLHVADAVAHFASDSGDEPAITAARETVMALISEEDTVLAALRGRLPT